MAGEKAFRNRDPAGRSVHGPHREPREIHDRETDEKLPVLPSPAPGGHQNDEPDDAHHDPLGHRASIGFRQEEIEQQVAHGVRSGVEGGPELGDQFRHPLGTAAVEHALDDR